VGLRFYAPGMVLYEFFILTAAFVGVIAMTAMRAWSRSAMFFLLWTALSSVYFLASRERVPEQIIQILLPAVFIAAIGLDCMHRTRAWRFIRVAVVVLGFFTIYVQLLTNLVYNAPDASEAPWMRHANLYWRDGATTLQARERLTGIRDRFPATGGGAFNSAAWKPALRWYLRDFRPTTDAKLADVLVNHDSTAAAEADSEFASTYVFDLEESWAPTLARADPASALRFVLSAISWSPLASRRVSLTVQSPGELSPTLIMPPGQP
jgi:hypothetical protein